jgi:hypothetical protein
LPLRLLVFPVLCLAAAPVTILSAPPGVEGPFLVVVPPWLGASSVVEAAGGSVVGPTAAPLAVLAMAEAPDFQARARSTGAFVRDGRLLAAICGVL